MVDVYTFPASVYPDQQRLTPFVGDGGQQSQRSEFNDAESVVTWYGSERWRLEMTLSDLTGDRRADVQAFVTKLRISRNVFLCVNHTAPQRGVLSGTPMVNSMASRTELAIGNLGISISSYFRDGDFFSVNSELKMVTDDAGTNGSGIVVVPFWPPLRETPSSGDLVKVNSPVGAFRMERAVDFNTGPPGYRTSMVISARERVNSSFVSELL